MKIVVYNMDEIEVKRYQGLEEKLGVQLVLTDKPAELPYVSLAEGAQAICIRPYRMGREQIQAFYNAGVRYISTRTIGYDHIDLEAAREIGMAVGNTGYIPENVAEYTVMLILMACRNIKEIARKYDIGDFTISPVPGQLLKGKTVGVIGTGRIGKKVIDLLTPFQCSFLAYDVYQDPALEGKAVYTDLDTLLEKSDILTLHAAATPENYHLLDRERFRAMKEGMILVNASRGTLIDTEALTEALDQGKVSMAALDVIEGEESYYYLDHSGKELGHEGIRGLRERKNVILTPHMAFYTESALNEIVENALTSCVNELTGKPNRCRIV